MANIKLKDRNDTEQTYNGMNTLTVPKADSGYQIFTAGEAQEKTIALSMPSGADQYFPAYMLNASHEWKAKE